MFLAGNIKNAGFSPKPGKIVVAQREKYLTLITLDGLAGKQPGIGGAIEGFLMPKVKSPRKEFLDALAKLLARAGALRPISPNLRERKKTIESQDMTTVLPDIGDRMAHGREALWGGRPILFTTSIRRPRARLIPWEAVHVYLDVSGSMINELPWLAAALDPLERRGAIKLYAFSTIVSKVRRGGLLKDAIQNTFGTDINCVLEHLFGLPKHTAPRQAVILTDGYVGDPKHSYMDKIKRKKVLVNFGFVGSYFIYAWVKKIAKTIMVLPALKEMESGSL